jgi:hypothetical protein
LTTYGPAYVEKIDGQRIRQQLIAIREYMLDGQWRSLHEISTKLSYPEASISAQLRHLRKPQFGGYTVEKRRRTEGAGTWEYRVADGG